MEIPIEHYVPLEEKTHYYGSSWYAADCKYQTRAQKAQNFEVKIE